MRIGGQLQIGGARPDGVVLVGVGDHQMVLLNVLEGFRTRVLDELVVNNYGPWVPCKPTRELRERVKHLLDHPGPLVLPDFIGSEDRAEVELNGRPAPSRQDFVNMLEQVGLAVGDVFPTDEQPMAEDPDFLNTCLSTVVPQMTASGLVIDDPSGFCALMHLERTGLMPRGDAMPATPPAEPRGEDIPTTADPNAPVDEFADPLAAAAAPSADPLVVPAPDDVITAAPPVVAETPAVETPIAVAPPLETVVEEIPAAPAANDGQGTIGKPFKKPRSMQDPAIGKVGV